MVLSVQGMQRQRLRVHAGVVRAAASLGTPPDFPASAVGPLLCELPAEAFQEDGAIQQALQCLLLLLSKLHPDSQHAPGNNDVQGS